MSTEQPSNKPTDIDVLNARLGAIKQAFAHLLVVTEQATSAVAVALAQLVLVGVPTMPSPTPWAMGSATPSPMPSTDPDEELEESTALSHPGAHIDLDGNATIPWTSASKTEKANAADLLETMIRVCVEEDEMADVHELQIATLRGLLKAIKDGAV